MGTNQLIQNEAVLYLTLLTFIVSWESFWQNQSFYLKYLPGVSRSLRLWGGVRRIWFSEKWSERFRRKREKWRRPGGGWRPEELFRIRQRHYPHVIQCQWDRSLIHQILFSRFTRDLFQVKVEYENMILRNPNVCNLFKEIKELRLHLWKSEDLLKKRSQFWRIGLTHQDHQTIQGIHHLVCNTQKKLIFRHGNAWILAPITSASEKLAQKRAKMHKINVELPEINTSP